MRHCASSSCCCTCCCSCCCTCCWSRLLYIKNKDENLFTSFHCSGRRWLCFCFCFGLSCSRSCCYCFVCCCISETIFSIMGIIHTHTQTHIPSHTHSASVIHLKFLGLTQPWGSSSSGSRIPSKVSLASLAVELSWGPSAALSISSSNSLSFSHILSRRSRRATEPNANGRVSQ